MKNRILIRRTVVVFLLTLFLASVSGQPQSSGSHKRSGRKVAATATRAPSMDFPLTPEQRREQQEAAIMLLNKAPVVNAADRLDKEEFITFSRGVSLDERVKISSYKQAVAALEQILATASDAKAILKSDPDKNDVHYRRFVDDSAPWQNATTNTEVSLRPALYVFRCTNRETNETQEKTQSCTTKCTVEFKF